MAATASSGLLIERKYRSGGTTSASWSFEVAANREGGEAGVADPMLIEPIDYEAEKAERERDFEAIEPYEGETRNSLFGV